MLSKADIVIEKTNILYFKHTLGLWAFNRRLAFIAIFFILNSCASMNESRVNPRNWFGDEEIDPPTELMAIEREVSLRRIWSASIGKGQGDVYNSLTPALDGEMLYAASANGVVAAHSAVDGALVWSTNLDIQLTGGAGIGSGLVFVASEDARVIALDQNSGEISWSAPVSSEVLSAPNARGDVVVLQTVDEKLIALSVEDGAQRWTYETTLPALTLRGSSTPVISSSGLVLAGFSNGTLVAVNASDGVWRWEERVAVPEGEYDIDRVIDIDGDLLVDGQRIFASSYQGNLMALDIETGRIVWGLEASSYHGLAQGFGNLYYVDDESQVFAVRDNTDEVVWENFDLKFRPLTAPLSFNNFVAVADFEGYVHLLSQIDGRIVGREQIDSSGVRSNLLSANGLLYAYGNSGRLSAYRIE